MEKIIKFCYLEPPYPEETLLTYIFIKGLVNEQERYITSVQNIVSSSIDESIKFAKETLNDYYKKIHLPWDEASDNLICIPLFFDRKYPLKKEYWTDGPEVNETNERMESYLKRWSFNQALYDPELYEVIIAPYGHDKKKKIWNYLCLFSVYKSFSDQTINNLFIASHEPVFYQAKSAGIYRLGEPFKINWKTKEKSELGTDTTTFENTD